jgi:hypothetical protein
VFWLASYKSPIEFPDELDSFDQNQPFRDALKKLLALHLYLISNPIVTPDEVERGLENDFILFAPHMTFAFSWHAGAFPKLEYQLQEVERKFRQESRKLESENDRQYINTETHLLGLDWVDETIYDEYAKATNKTQREKILAKIEDEVGWSVGSCLSKLLRENKEEIAKYVDEQKRPSLRKFISFFQN